MAQFKWQLIFLAFVLCQKYLEAHTRTKQRIIKGSPAVDKQFPYQVRIVSPDTLPNGTMVTYACGGVIISKRSILTAAHCIMRNFLGLIIYFGANRSTGQQRMIVEPRNIVVHPEYNSNTMFNDIALIKLPVDLAFNAYIQPAKLPAPSRSYDNENAIVSGWGVTENGHTSDRLLFTYITVLPADMCKHFTNYNNVHLVYSPSWICSTPSQFMTCEGDSGGPLAIKNDDGSSTLIGLVSFGLDKECKEILPTFFTRVSSYLQWINQYESIV